MHAGNSTWDHTKYLKTSGNFKLSPRAVQYFKTLDAAIQNSKSTKNEGNVVPASLLTAFKLLSRDQKIKYITENLKYVSSISKNNNENVYKLTTQDKIVEVTCKKRKLCCFSSTYLKLKLQTQPRTLLAKDTQNIKMIQLQKYIVRHEKAMNNYKICLQPIIQSSSSWKGINQQQYTMSRHQFDLIYEDLYNCIMDIRNEELVSLFTNNNNAVLANSRNSYQNNIETNLSSKSILHQQQLIQITDSRSKIPKNLLNTKQYKLFSKFKKKVLNQKSISYMKFQDVIYEQVHQNTQLIIRRNLKQPFLFKVEIFSIQSVYQIKHKFLQLLQQNRNQLLIQSELLQVYEQSVLDCVALYQKYLINNTPYSTIYMRQITSLTNLLMANSLTSINEIEEKKRYDDFMFCQSLDSPFAKSFFKYMCVFASEHTHNKKYMSELVIIGEFNLNEKFTTNMAKQFLSQYYYTCFGLQRKQKIDFAKKQSLKTINQAQIPNKPLKQAINVEQLKQNGQKISTTSQTNNNNKQIPIQFAQPELGIKQVRSKFITQQQQETVNKLTAPYLRHRFNVKPISGFNLDNNLVKQSFMKNQWLKSKSGGLICTNEKLLSEHKKIFKHILASIGSNILKGGNILNVSLPVTIFKKQGHLQMIADSFSLTPKLLQGVNDPLQRMKKAIIISVSVGTLGISVEKPFFPTLGETLQVWIGGCPMYMEQITRYPPTGAYLFYGRGYRIHGQVQPKISFGINGGKGYSQRPSYIQFDDGQIIQLSYGKLVISGIFVGDRQFNFYDKSFAYDKENSYYAQLIYGARDTQIFGKNKQTSDFLYGKIYEVNEQFKKKFEQSPIPKPFPNKKYINRIVSQFQGYWNGIIKFDDKEYIDFEKDLPNKVEVEQFALPSDTRFRKDLSNLLIGNIQSSQKQKQIIEETQRRDRKLRAEKQKKK